MKTKKCNHKPPMGIMPEWLWREKQWLWREKRVLGLMGAIVRTTEVCAINEKGCVINDQQKQKWTDELRAHLNWMYEYRKTNDPFGVDMCLDCSPKRTNKEDER